MRGCEAEKKRIGAGRKVRRWVLEERGTEVWRKKRCVRECVERVRVCVMGERVGVREKGYRGGEEGD